MTKFWISIFILVRYTIHANNQDHILENGEKDMKPEMKQILLPGDIILGGLFPMHEKGTGGRRCGDIKEDKGIQRVEAMLYAIDQINADDTLLPGITLGAQILDTCLRDTFGLEQSLEFIKSHMRSLDTSKYTCGDGGNVSIGGAIPSKPVAGVIGAAASPVSIMVANILRLFKIPQISYASTGIELSDKSRYGYFSRVVPPDSYQAQAMVHVVRAFGWKYVVTVADEGNYGEEGIDKFEELAKNESICVPESFKIPRETESDTFDLLIEKLLAIDKVRVVVLFANEDNCYRIIEAARNAGATDRFVWLASDSWGAKSVPVQGQEGSAEGTVTILPQRQTLKEFDRYFTRLRPSTNTRNKWFHEFWEKHFKCTFSRVHNKSIDSCTGMSGGDLREKHKQEGLVPFVVDAVYAMAHALHDMRADKCPNTRRGLCPAMSRIPGEELLHYIRNVAFQGVSNHEVRFNKDGDANGRYTIFQYQKTNCSRNNCYEYVPIGSWDERLTLIRSRVRWKGDSVTPVSICSEPCKLGEKRVDKDQCCWICIKCTDYEILENEATCTACPNGSLPNKNKTYCQELPLQYMSMTSIFAIVPMAFSVIGILGVIFIFIVFYRFDDTPVIMASGRELCYVLLAGFLLSYLMTFLMVAKPHIVTCGLLRLGLGTSLCMCYSALLTKTNRISRIFNRGIKAMVKRPSYTSPRSQIVICMTLVFVQLAGAIVWLVLEFPGTTKVFPDRETVVLRCKTSNLNIVISLLYNMVLIIMCTFYALKTRKIPENFNEAKYIAFTMYSTCIVWLAFVPTYFGTNKSDFRIQITALCMCVSISSTVALGCLFVPKVYIVLFQPHKNVRQSSKGGTMFSKKSALANLAGTMNGGVTSPTGLAMLIAKGNTNSSSTTTTSTTTRANGEKCVTRVTSSNIKFTAVKTDDTSDQELDLDTSEAEPEVHL